MDSVERATTGEDIQLLNSFPSQERAEQTTETEDVIEMPVREQDAGEILEATAEE